MRRGRVALAASAVVVLVAVVAVFLTTRSDPPETVTSNRVQIKKQLLASLHEQLLDPHWVVCIPSGRRYEGAAVIRCNVNFGDPHIEAYCSVMRGNELVTNHEDATIPCAHDDAGFKAPVTTFD